MASFYYLLKATDLTADVFNCPSTEADRAYVGEDIQNYANWPSPYASFSTYSYNCPFPTPAAVSGGWRFDTTLGPDYPFAADINPGMTNGAGPTTVGYTDGREAMQVGNSPNHWYEGQNVAYCDGHVEWQTSPFAGVQRAMKPYRDNIYTTGGMEVSSNGKGGMLWDKPVDAQDAVLLPTAQDSTGAAIAARLPGMSPPMEPAAKIMIGVGIAVILGLVVLGVWLAKRKPKQPAWQQAPGGMMPPGYPPPGQGYPPPGPGGGYPPGYPPTMYPPQQQQGGYPPIAGAPPAGYQPPKPPGPPSSGA